MTVLLAHDVAEDDAPRWVQHPWSTPRVILHNVWRASRDAPHPALRYA
ncbi:hypothetical protein M2152_000258 [Microbacteriaceae bacterium SG_E_30_P1]|uniref:Uncharacterized protein n=1 Tax=Antiquaquibacter oligotrophicus TaxID=2880260 RepID=A0ABT6KJI8_9MICO|nr:hypothetical protein [Antiquaquibacter oligotrophicus]MDH6180076.1 hypothetical protein [Antiquaquibacter oligotrophicus]UDF14173.1 hypothetical protein LH407_04750 [Antiquaquibacter oligotrophicus]